MVFFVKLDRVWCAAAGEARWKSRGISVPQQIYAPLEARYSEGDGVKVQSVSES